MQWDGRLASKNCTCPASTTLGHFREDYYRCLGRRADALFELTNALLTAGPLSSPVHLSSEPVNRRGWASFYAALRHGAIDTATLGTLLARHLLAGGQPIYAVDCSVWPRCDAEASPERGFSYHPSRHSAGLPIVAGWAYQWLAQLSFTRDCWTTPLDVRRVHPRENANTVAVEQMQRLAAHRSADLGIPLFIFDAGYDLAQPPPGIGEGPVAVPSPNGGRPRKHGAKFACKDPVTWPEPTAAHRVEDDQYGTVRLCAWARLHPKQQVHPGRGTRKTRPIVRGTVVLVEVSRVPARPYPPQVLWLWWAGPEGALDLDPLWRADVRRFDLEHTLRFGKQCLGGTMPRVRHPA